MFFLVNFETLSISKVYDKNAKYFAHIKIFAMNLVTSKRRLLQFLEFKGFDKPDFYEKTGIKRGLLDSDKLDASLNDQYLAKIIAIFSDLNLYWLITGEGEMIKKIDDDNTVILDSKDESFKFLLSRIEELAIENATLKNEVVELNKRKNYDENGKLSIASES